MDELVPPRREVLSTLAMTARIALAAPRGAADYAFAGAVNSHVLTALERGAPVVVSPSGLADHDYPEIAQRPRPERARAPGAHLRQTTASAERACPRASTNAALRYGASVARRAHMAQATFSAEVGRGLESDELPAYARMLDAYQRAFEPELKRIVSELPIAPGHHVLDLACGAGAYTRWLAERLGRHGVAVGVDLSPAYLDQAREQTLTVYQGEGRVEFAVEDAARLSFMDGTFDLSFCAQSLYSLPDPAAALSEMARVTRVGGPIVVLENDLVHQFMLPWPVDLELAVRQAQITQLRDQENGRAERFFVGRHLGALFEQAGINSYEIRSSALHRTGPLREPEESYLREYLTDLGERARPYLSAPDRERFDALIDPRLPTYLLRERGFHLTVLNQIAIGTCRSSVSVPLAS